MKIMTNEELAKSMLMELEGGYISYSNMHRDHGQGLKLIKYALEKQIPKKAVKSNGFHELGFCPNCNEPIKSRTSFKSTVGKIYISWCSECGQAIDWQEEEVNE